MALDEQIVERVAALHAAGRLRKGAHLPRIRALANHVVHVNSGQLTHYPGGYQYYLDKTKAQSERAGLTSRAR